VAAAFVRGRDKGEGCSRRTRTSSRRAAPFTRTVPSRISTVSPPTATTRFTYSTGSPAVEEAASVHIIASTAMAKFANRWDFGWEIAHGAVSRRTPIYIHTVVARNHRFTTRREILGFCHRSRTVLCRLVPNASIAIRNFFSIASYPRGG
jgi:hypothetical protein